MKKLKKKQLPITKILFTYLAISKIMYWYETITTMNGLDLSSTAQKFLERFISRDLLLIIGVILFYYFEKIIFNKKSQKETLKQHIMYYVSGYLSMIAVLLFLMLFAWQGYDRSLWMGTLVDGTLGYIVIMIALNVKDYFKSKKEKADRDTVNRPEDSIAMLYALLDKGILSQEEFEEKCQKIENET